MNEQVKYSLIFAPLILAGLFFLCLVVVCGIKSVYLSVKSKFFKKPQKRKYVKRSNPKPKTTPTPVRSIEINPEEVDRIYVRKSS